MGKGSMVLVALSIQIKLIHLTHHDRIALFSGWKNDRSQEESYDAYQNAMEVMLECYICMPLIFFRCANA